MAESRMPYGIEMAYKIPIGVVWIGCNLGWEAGRLAMRPVLGAVKSIARQVSHQHISERLAQEVPIGQVEDAVHELQESPSMDAEKAAYLAALAIRGVELADKTATISDATTRQLAFQAVSGLDALPPDAELLVSDAEVNRVLDLAAR